MPSFPHLLATMATVATLLFLPPASDGKVVLDLQWNGTDVLEESFQELFRVRSNVENMADYLTSKIDQIMDSWCPRPFRAVMSQCFYVNNKNPMSWEKGRAFCGRMGGDLAQPAFVNALLVVLTDRYPRERSVYLGASNRTKDQGWQWISGRPVDPNIWEDKLMPDDNTAGNHTVRDDKAMDDKAKGGKAKGVEAKGGKAKGVEAKGGKAKGGKATGVEAKGGKAKGVEAKGVEAKGGKAKGDKVEGEKAMCLVLCPDGCSSSHVVPSSQDCDLDSAFVCEYKHK